MPVEEQHSLHTRGTHVSIPQLAIARGEDAKSRCLGQDLWQA